MAVPISTYSKGTYTHELNSPKEEAHQWAETSLLGTQESAKRIH